MESLDNVFYYLFAIYQYPNKVTNYRQFRRDINMLCVDSERIIKDINSIEECNKMLILSKKTESAISFNIKDEGINDNLMFVLRVINNSLNDRINQLKTHKKI